MKKTNGLRLLGLGLPALTSASFLGAPIPQGTLLIKDANLVLDVKNIDNAGRHLKLWLGGVKGYYADWDEEREGEQC